MLQTGAATATRRSCTAMKSRSHLLQLEKAYTHKPSHKDPVQPKIKRELNNQAYMYISLLGSVLPQEQTSTINPSQMISYILTNWELEECPEMTIFIY